MGDNFITSDTTEDQIVQFFKELCHTLGSLLGASIEEQCNTLMETQLPAIIEGSSTTTSTHSRSATPSGCAREHFLTECTSECFLGCALKTLFTPILILPVLCIVNQ